MEQEERNTSCKRRGTLQQQRCFPLVGGDRSSRARQAGGGEERTGRPVAAFCGVNRAEQLVRRRRATQGQGVGD